MNNHAHHEELIQGLRKQLKPILESSAQGIYVYLDDNHKVCNSKFAMMLGYGSAEEWEMVSGSFPELFVDTGSRSKLIEAYRGATEMMVGSSISISWKNKAGGSVASSVILVPMAYQDHIVALHFVSA